MSQKRKPIRDENLKKEIRKKGCLGCGRFGWFVRPHHIKTRGSGGDDSPWNMVPLCDDHHTLGQDAIHRIGDYEFAEKFPAYKEFLNSNGWEFCPITKRVFHVEDQA